MENIKIRLPEVKWDETRDDDPEQCAVCGRAWQSQTGFFAGGGLPMTGRLDLDLCTECALHLWRSLKGVYKEGAVGTIYALFSVYPETHSAVADSPQAVAAMKAILGKSNITLQ